MDGIIGDGNRALDRPGLRQRSAAALRRLRRKRYRRGFSLFGVLLGLTLAAVAIVGAVSLYNAARESANRSEALTLLNRLRANVESVYAGAPSYGNNADLIATIDRRGRHPRQRPRGERVDGADPPSLRRAGDGDRRGRAATPTNSASSSTTWTTRSAPRWATPMPGAPAPGQGSSR